MDQGNLTREAPDPYRSSSSVKVRIMLMRRDTASIIYQHLYFCQVSFVGVAKTPTILTYMDYYGTIQNIRNLFTI